MLISLDFRKRLIVLAFLIGIGILGLVLRFVFISPELDFLLDFNTHNILLGLLLGVISAIIAGSISLLPIFREVRQVLLPAVKLFASPFWFAFLVSLLAGIGEELLFRAFLQELIGLVPAAIVFVAVHGYYFPKPRTMPLLGILVTGIALLLGFLYENLGYWTAVAMHFSYDFVLLLAVNLFLKKSKTVQQ